MNQPEYILEESEKTLLTEKRLANLIQELTMVEVDLVVLSRELQSRADLSTRIGISLREVRQSLEQVD